MRKVRAVPPTQKSLKPRRAPLQQRSRERVARILDATAKLIAQGGLEAVTTNGIARKAGLPVGTLYQFFPHREAVLQALIESQLASLDAPLRPLLAPGPLSLDQRVERVVDVLHRTYRRLPALAHLMHAARGDPRVSPLSRANNEKVSGWVVPLVHQYAPGVPPARARAVATATVEAADALLMAALREQRPARARALLDELKAMLRGYLRAVAGDPGPPGAQPRRNLSARSR